MVDITRLAHHSGSRRISAGLCHVRRGHERDVWLSRTVEVQDNQQVVDTGLYGIVRHPMYSATLILFLAMPLVLASPWSFVIMLLYLPIVVKRIHNEETVLKQELGGYKEYIQRIRYRLIPLIW